MKICNYSLINLINWVKLVLFCFIFLQTQKVDAGFACMENPCFHGLCIDFLDRNSTHQCFCKSGFTGYECQINWDECRSNPCLNNGICWDKIDEFACECPENFAGSLCQYDLAGCQELFPCFNNGSCTIDTRYANETFMCLCPTGFEGTQCEVDVSICNTTEITCQNGGTCVDGSGDKFHCQCLAGWKGEMCEIEIDICESQPCQNGGVCVNKLNDFACACDFGYTGKMCEKKLKICKVNPCKNGAFCLHENENETDFTCYCVPDFHGNFCEFQYDDCDPLPKCYNGGTCIDGVGTYHCSCPPNFFGPTCLCTAENMTDSSCSNSTTLSPTEIFQSPSITSTIHIPQSSTFISMTESLPEEPSTATLSPIIIMSPSQTPDMETTRIVIDSELFASTSSISISPTVTEINSAITPELPSSAVEITASLEGSESITFPPSIIITTSLIISTSIPSLTISVSDELETTIVPSVTTELVSYIEVTTASVQPFPSPQDEIGVKTSSVAPSQSVLPFTSTLPDKPIEPTISYDVSTVELESEFYLSSSQTALSFPDTISLSTNIIITSEIPITLYPSLSELIPSISAFESEIINFPNISNTPFITTSTIEIPMTQIVSETETIEATTTILLEPQSSLPFTTTPEPSISIGSSSSPLPTTSTTESGADLCHNHCLNNGKCIWDNIEPSCICPFKWSGDRCETPRRKFTSTSFTGDSFLSYKVSNDTLLNKTSVKTQLATNAPDGILLFTSNNLGKIYALIFTQGGHLSLHFSCGEKSMSMVETRTRIDNGFNFTLEFTIEMISHDMTDMHCVGQVSVNHSYIMRGEQIVGRNKLQDSPITIINLGGVDATIDNYKKSDELIALMPGFKGCVYKLSINEEDKDLFDDAIDGKEVAECSAFGCVTNPCFGASKCVPWNKFPFWQCACLNGFQGVRCQVRVCDTNPCKNGGTCTFPLEENGNSSTEISRRNHSSTICLCSLGFRGPECESLINITKPSFKPLNFDYSSFVAYEPVPRFADWMQMKLHFVTRNISQIALLLYVGHTQSLSSPAVSSPDELDALTELVKDSTPEAAFELTNEVSGQRVSDFFAITYVQGYVALTWNLGSGTQRIITPSRIDKRLNVHTLFAGRSGRQAWLKVDGMRNVTGKTPGPFYRLNTNSELFLGGHEAFRFENLPHDLPMHRGFEGCLFDFGIRVKNRLYLPRALRGRNIKNCYEEDC